MKKFTIRDGVLVLIAFLLTANLVVLFSPPAHALGKAEYKAISMDNLGDASGAQRTLNQMSSQGWGYVGSAGAVMIFKK